MNKSKNKGTRLESGLVRYLKAKTGDSFIHRSALHGNHDEGDVQGINAHGAFGIAEVKNVRELTPSLLSKFELQTDIERGNANADFAFLFVHEPGCDQTGTTKTFGRNSVYITVRDLATVTLCLHADETPYRISRLLDDTWVRLTLDDFVNLLTDGEPNE